MASVNIAPTSGLRAPNGNSVGVDRLPDEMNDMKIRDDKVDHGVSLLHLFVFLFWSIVGLA